MTNLHLLKLLEHYSESFHHTDPNAWIVLVSAIGYMAAILTALLSH